MKILSWKIKKHNPDHILISSFAIAKNIDQCRTTNIWSNSKFKTQHSTLYLHSPMQYIRSHKQEYTKKITWWKWRLFKKIINKLQKRDLKFTNYNDVFSNSKYTQELTKKIYNIESKIKYPKISQMYFDEKIITKPKEYMICIGRVVKFVKEVDLIIKAFNEIWYPLIIIWSWPDEQELKKMAKKNIKFTGRNPPNMIDIIKNAKWAINLTKESFGIGTAECLCLWVPVLWYNQWATPELVDKKSGILIANKTEKDIITNFSKFIQTKRDREEIAKTARKTFIRK